MSSSEFEHCSRKTPTTPQLTPDMSKSFARSPFPLEPYRQISSSAQTSKRSYKSLAVHTTRRRVIFKNGDCNVVQYGTSKHRLRYIRDIFTTLVDTQWRWTLSIFSIVFFGSWFAFALIWWLVALTHGDLEEDHLPKNQLKNNWRPCVTAIESFTSAFLFSFETQHTTGYGVKVMTDECPEAIFLMCVQSILGLIIQAFMVGVVFAKMTRPKLRKQTLQFSKKAVICQRDGNLCLMFRVADIRKSHIIGARISARLIHSRHTKEGDVMKYFQTELSLTADNCEGELFLVWPMTLVHKIDENSPLYYLSASDLWHDKFEIVVILDGTIESTGQPTQAKSSYLSQEVLWGYKFEEMIEYNRETQAYEVDYSKFENTLPFETPLCSAEEMTKYFCESMKHPTLVSGQSSPS